jgi:acyl dehydratase
MSPGQPYFEDVEIGALLPPLTKGPLAIKDMVKFGAATDDWSEIHFDESVVRQRGLPAPVVHGPLKSAFLAQMLTAWMGSGGTLTRLACQYRGMDAAGETITCRGKVVGRSSGQGGHLIECEVWTENSTGEITTRGHASIALPLRSHVPHPAPDPSRISLITDEMRRDLRLGEVSGVFTYDADRRWIREFASAFGDSNPLWHDEAYAHTEGRFGGIIAPPTFFGALDPVERFHPIREEKELLLDPWVETMPYQNTGGGNAFSEVEYFLPIYAGDTITVEVTYTDIFERDGRSGRLLFRIRENVLKNQRDELVAKARSGHVRSYDLTKPREAGT